MRKLLITLIILLYAPLVFGQTILVPNQQNIYWDEVTTKANGDPLTDLVGYEVYLMLSSLDKAEPVNWIFMGPATDTQFTLLFTTEGLFLTGVRAKRVVDGWIGYFSG